MKTIINLTESDLYRIVKRIIKEGYSEEHLKYTHPRTGDECKIKVAKRKFDNRYGAVLTCDVHSDGNESVVAEIPVIKRNKEDVVKFICDHIEKTYEILDNMLTVTDDDFIMEGSEYSRFEIIDEPINCSVNRESNPQSWEIE
jgi:hypothetical protein